jgi:hypothetical protein
VTSESCRCLCAFFVRRLIQNRRRYLSIKAMQFAKVRALSSLSAAGEICRGGDFDLTKS